MLYFQIIFSLLKILFINLITVVSPKWFIGIIIKFSLIQCSNEYNDNVVLCQLKSIDSIHFRVMRENSNILKINSLKLEEAIKFIMSSVNYVEINKCVSVLFDNLLKACSLSDQIKFFNDFHLMSIYDIK